MIPALIILVVAIIVFLLLQRVPDPTVNRIGVAVGVGGVIAAAFVFIFPAAPPQSTVTPTAITIAESASQPVPSPTISSIKPSQTDDTNSVVPTFTPEPPTITPVLPPNTPAPPSNSPIPSYQDFSFRDDFNGRLRDEWQTLNAEYTIQGSELSGTGTVLYEVKHKNVVIRTRAKGKYIGLFFRDQPNSNGYYIGFAGQDERFRDKNVIILYEVTDGKQNIRQINLPPSVDMNNYNEFEIIVENKNAVVKINNEQVGTFVIGKYLEGYRVGIGFFPETTIDYFEASSLP